MKFSTAGRKRRTKKRRPKMYKLMVSYDCGGDYVPDSESENINDLRPKMQDLDDQKLRWYLEKDGEPLGTIAYWHLRYTFGEEQIKSHPNTWLRELADLSDASMEEVWKAVNEQYIFLPLSLLDHSGLHMWVGKGAHYSDPGAISRCLTSTHLCVEMLS